MIRIRHVHGQDVTEHGGGLIEGDTVPAQVERRFSRVPLKLNHGRISANLTPALRRGRAAKRRGRRLERLVMRHVH